MDKAHENRITKLTPHPRSIASVANSPTYCGIESLHLIGSFVKPTRIMERHFMFHLIQDWRQS